MGLDEDFHTAGQSHVAKRPWRANPIRSSRTFSSRQKAGHQSREDSFDNL